MRLASILGPCAVLLACAACGEGSPGTDIQLTVVDATLRKPGVPCSGAGGYLEIHRGAAYRVVDPADGSVLVGGTLPSGVAVRMGEPIEGAAVEPTACRLTFTADLPERARYELKLPGNRSIPFTPAQPVKIRIP